MGRGEQVGVLDWVNGKGRESRWESLAYSGSLAVMNTKYL